MNIQCSKCGTHLTAPWNFCPNCGATVAHEIHTHAAVHEAAERAPVQGAFGGLLIGMVAVPILIIVGTMLCLTGLGAIAGIPMIIGGALAPLLGPMIGIGTLQGKCPWCGTKMSSVIDHPQGFYCHACSNRIVIEDRKFTKAA